MTDLTLDEKLIDWCERANYSVEYRIAFEEALSHLREIRDSLTASAPAGTREEELSEDARKFAEIMAGVPRAKCLHGTPLADLCEQCVASDEFDPMNVLDFCEGAIRDAIGLEDGLDGAAGEGVLSMIRTCRARVAAPPAVEAREPVTDDTLNRYEELIYAVGKKYPNEARHETALRYIRERETPSRQAMGCGAKSDAALHADAEGGRNG